MRIKPYLPISLFAAVLSVGLLLTSHAHAQASAKVLATCNTASYTAGTTNYSTIDVTGGGCGPSGGSVISGTVTANQGTASNLNVQAVGDSASGSADSGSNPMKIGCVATSGSVAVTNGQRANCTTDLFSSVMVLPRFFVGSQSDGQSNSIAFPYSAANLTVATALSVTPQNYNGSTLDRQRGNFDTAALLSPAAQAAGTLNSADQTNYNGRGVQVGVNLTTVTTCSVATNIQGKDAASGTYYTILSSAAAVTAGFTNLTVYPGAATTANVSSPQPVPRVWRVQEVFTGASCAVTGTVGASVIN